MKNVIIYQIILILHWILIQILLNCIPKLPNCQTLECYWSTPSKYLIYANLHGSRFLLNITIVKLDTLIQIGKRKKSKECCKLQTILEFSCHRQRNNLGTYWHNLGIVRLAKVSWNNNNLSQNLRSFRQIQYKPLLRLGSWPWLFQQHWT